MAQVMVIIGELSRPLFAESLLLTLSASAEFRVRTARASEVLQAVDGTAPTVLILDAANPGIDLSDLPKVASLATILISGEGREARILLNQIEAERIRALGRFIAAAPGLARIAAESAVKNSLNHLRSWHRGWGAAA